MAVIRGWVVDAAGKPVEHAAVYVLSAPEPQPDISQLTGADGSFAIGATTPGVYAIGARSDADGEGRGEARLAPDISEVTIRIVLRAPV